MQWRYYSLVISLQYFALYGTCMLQYCKISVMMADGLMTYWHQDIGNAYGDTGLSMDITRVLM